MFPIFASKHIIFCIVLHRFFSLSLESLLKLCLRERQSENISSIGDSYTLDGKTKSKYNRFLAVSLSVYHFQVVKFGRQGDGENSNNNLEHSENFFIYSFKKDVPASLTTFTVW